jgi:hypothetical protein
MRKQAVLVALALVLAPVGAKAADLVLWCDEPYYAEEGEAIREIITAFEQGSGKQVELVFHPVGASKGNRGGAESRPAARLRVRPVIQRLCRTMGIALNRCAVLGAVRICSAL